MKSTTSPAPPLLALPLLVFSMAALAPALPAAEPPLESFADVSFRGAMGFAMIAEAPSDPRRIYLLSGEGNLLRSDDAGASFSASGLAGLPGRVISAILVHPSDAEKLYLISSPIGAEFRVFSSADGGHSVAVVPLPPGARELWIEPHPPHRIWTALPGRLAVQEAEGFWRELPLVVPGNPGMILRSLAFDPQRAGRLLAAVSDGDFGEPANGIYESRDDGLTWIARLAGQSSGVQFDPFSSALVWAITSNGGEDILWRSLDGGMTFFEASYRSSGGLVLLFDPHRPGHLLLTLARHGNQRTTLSSRDGGESWQILELPIPPESHQFPSLLRDGRWILSGGAGFLESRDAGASWQSSPPALPSRVVALAVDPQNPEHAWAANDSGVFRSTRGGASWHPVFSPGAPLGLNATRLAVDPEDNRVVYLAHSRDGAGPCIWRSTDRGRTFTEVVAAAGWMALTSFEIGRIGDLSYVLASFWTTSGPLLWRSTDHGATWRQHALEFSGVLAADPESGVVYQPAGSELRRSLDGGLSFVAIRDFSPLGAAPQRIVAGRRGDLFVLTAKTDYPAELQLFELRPGREPVESRLPGDLDGECYSLAIGLLQPGIAAGELYLSQYCGDEGERLWRTRDGGRNWEAILRGPPKGGLRTVVPGRDGASIWLVPSDFGIYRGRIAEERLFLQRRRFAVTASARGPAGEESRGRPFFLTDETGYFSFGSPDRIDLAVKILDGRPLTGAFWTFAASLTDAQLDIEVRDLETGEVEKFHHPAGSYASFADYEALAAANLAPRRLDPSPSPLALAGGRFEVSVDWRDFEGASGNGQARRLAGDTAVFSFFWEGNVELIVQLTRGPHIDGPPWVSFAGLTNVEYFLTLRDTLTGQTWNRHNPLGAFASGIDRNAFPAASWNP